MSRVLFGQSYFLRFDPKLWEGMQPYPPLGTLYAAAFVRERGYDVALFDAMLAESESEWDAALSRHRPDFAVLFEDNFNYLSKMCLLRMREAAMTMIRMAKRRGCTVIVCGSDATDQAERYVDAGADYIIRGEGEQTLVELLDALDGRNGHQPGDVIGLSYRHDGSMTRTESRPVMRDLDGLPRAAWDLVDVERYRQVWLERHGYFSMNLVTTRGCPYHCNWCAKPIWGQRYNVRSPEAVVDELVHLKDNYAPDHIWYADDIMGLKPGWLARFADLVEEHNARIPFKCLSRADLMLRDGDVDALRRAGAEIVWLGAESGSQKILDAMEKGTWVEQIYDATERLHDAGIEVAFFLQFGYPGETREDIELTRQMVRECQPDDIGISVSYPLPGTKFHKRVEAELGTKQNWVDSADLDMMYAGPFSTAFYRKLHEVIHKEFRASRHRRKLRRRLREPVTLQASDARRFASMVYNRVSLTRAERQLDALARAPHQGLRPLAGELSTQAAAEPSPQD